MFFLAQRLKFVGLGVCLLFLISGCVSQPISLLNAPLDSGDEAPLPPTPEELRSSKSFIAFVPVQYSENLSRYHKVLSLSFVQSVLEEHGDLAIVDDVRVERALSRSDFAGLRVSLKQGKLRRFEDSLVEQAVRLGKWLRVRYIVLMRVQPSPVKVSVNDWSTYISFRIYRVEDPVKNEMNHEFTFVFSESNSLWDGLGNLIRGRFPLSGFILESRANHTFVKISLGRRNRIMIEQECKIFRRIQTEQTGADGSIKTTIGFDLLGRLSIFNVQEDFAWGQVRPEDRKKILTGDAVRCY